MYVSNTTNFEQTVIESPRAGSAESGIGFEAADSSERAWLTNGEEAGAPSFDLFLKIAIIN